MSRHRRRRGLPGTLGRTEAAALWQHAVFTKWAGACGRQCPAPEAQWPGASLADLPEGIAGGAQSVVQSDRAGQGSWAGRGPVMFQSLGAGMVAMGAALPGTGLQGKRMALIFLGTPPGQRPLATSTNSRSGSAAAVDFGALLSPEPCAKQ